MTPHLPADDDASWTARLRRWGLDDVAPILVEALRPLSWIGGQLLMVAAPLLTTFVDARQIDRWVDLLEDPDRLERIDQQPDREEKR